MTSVTKILGLNGCYEKEHKEVRKISRECQFNTEAASHADEMTKQR
jgi:hypothetical protein